jgi:hypothetical protein
MYSTISNIVLYTRNMLREKLLSILTTHTHTHTHTQPPHIEEEEVSKFETLVQPQYHEK